MWPRRVGILTTAAPLVSAATSISTNTVSLFPAKASRGRSLKGLRTTMPVTIAATNTLLLLSMMLPLLLAMRSAVNVSCAQSPSV